MGDLTSGYVRLSEPPMWCIQYPTCSACDCALETDGDDGDGWLCPTCGTSWSMNANDGDRGELYESWSGEEATGPKVTESEASDIAYYRERLRLHEAFPDLIPEPTAPRFRADSEGESND